MKKLILSAAALMTFGLANAQIGTAGFQENWDNDQYTNTLYWWEPKVDGFDFTTLREDDGTTVTFTQEVGGFEPFGISFGKDSTETSEGVFDVFDKTLDMSGDKTFSFTIENLGTEDIQIRITLQDVAENVVDTKSSAIDEGDTTDAPWEHALEFDLDAGESLTFSDSWEGTHKAWYDDNGTFIGLTSDLDYTGISGLQFTVINDDDFDGDGDENGENKYAHMGLTDYSVKFTAISAGDLATVIDPEGDDDNDGVANLIDACPDTEAGATVDERGCSATGIAELKASIGLSVSPNPSSSDVIVSFNGLAEVSLVTESGVVVSSTTGVGSASFDVSALAAGVYYAKVVTDEVSVTEAIVVE